MKREEKKEILRGVQAQINSFDNKASILLAAMGIVFGLAISLIDVVHTEWFSVKCATFKHIFIGLSIAFLIISVIEIIMFVLVLIPRRSKEKNKYADYYNDIAECPNSQLNCLFIEYSKNDDLLDEQIKNNSIICNKKHLFLEKGIRILIPFIIILCIMFIMIIAF